MALFCAVQVVDLVKNALGSTAVTTSSPTTTFTAKAKNTAISRIRRDMPLVDLMLCFCRYGLASDGKCEVGQG